MQYKLSPAEWLSLIIDAAEEISSEEFQCRVWLLGTGSEISSYEEAVCNFFDAAPEAFVKNTDILSSSQENALLRFIEALRRFNDGVLAIPSPSEVLDHPDWPAVRSAARQCVEMLKR